MQKEYKTILTERLEFLDANIKGWQKQMQNPNLSTYDQFVKYAKIMADTKRIEIKVWDKQAFHKRQKLRKKYRRITNIKNRIILWWLDIKDNFHFC